MGHAARQPPHGLHLLGLAQLAFQQVALAHIPQDGQHPLLPFDAQRGEGDLHQEGRSVPPHVLPLEGAGTTRVGLPHQLQGFARAVSAIRLDLGAELPGAMPDHVTPLQPEQLQGGGVGIQEGLVVHQEDGVT